MYVKCKHLIFVGEKTTQRTITCSKSTLKTQEQGVKYANMLKVNHKDTRNDFLLLTLDMYLFTG